MKISIKILLFLLAFCSENVKAQQSVRKKRPVPIVVTNKAIFLQKLKMPVQKNIPAEIVALGMSFLNNPYPNKPVDTVQHPTGFVQLQPISAEVLVVNLKQFDCVTFVENMVALAQTKHEEQANFETYKNNLTLVRYRNGWIDYSARLHYFSDWLFENEKRGILKIITKDLGSEIYPKSVFYMSFKKDTLYGNMADPNTFVAMQKVENDITNREKTYIPKEKVADMESQLKDGDIIGITNRLEGMDMAHVGIVKWVKGQPHLLHASSQYHKVMITEGSLSEYLLRNKGQTGIMVGRLVD